MILTSLYKFLSTRQPTICNTIYPDPLPQRHRLPAISLEDNGAKEELLLDSSVQSLRSALVTVLCWSESILTADALADRVYAEMVGYVGPFGDVEARLISLESRNQGPENETGLRSISLAFEIAYI